MDDTNQAEEVENNESVSQEMGSENISDDNNSNTESSDSHSGGKDKEYNFQELRKSADEAKRRADILEQELHQIKSNYQNNSTKEEKTEEKWVDDEDLVEGKHFNKLQGEIKALRDQIYKKEQESIPDRLKSKFSDFDEIVTKENVEKLQREEPELFASISSTGDLYKSGVAAYKTLTSLGYASSDGVMNRKKLEENQNKPRSTQSLKGQGAIHEANLFANGLTPELRKQLQKEMAEASKGF